MTLDAATRGSPRRWGPPALALAPLLVLLCLFFAVPTIDLVHRSFLDAAGQVTVEHYVAFLEVDAYRKILVRTFGVALACTVICALIAYPYAYLMTLVGAGMRGFLLILVLLPFWTSLMVRTFAWLILLQENGPVQAVLAAVGITGVELVRNTAGVLIAMAQILLPFMVLPLYNNLAKIDRVHLLAGQSLGATPGRAFWRVYFPQSLPGLFAGCVLVFILALGFYITPAILGSPQNSMMSQLIFRQVSERLDWASGGAMGVVLTVLTLLGVAVVARHVNIRSAFGGTGSSDDR